jgi:UDP-N-acetylmuramyl tripeptide synthase
MCVGVSPLAGAERVTGLIHAAIFTIITQDHRIFQYHGNYLKAKAKLFTCRPWGF